jgi:hypothetical protein
VGLSLPAGATLRGAVQRWVQALVSRQYHRMSSQQSPPSGIMLLDGARIPHIQHETMAACGALLPALGERRVLSAMASPPVGQPRHPHRAPEKREDKSGQGARQLSQHNQDTSASSFGCHGDM